jgi:hypothetical protein
MNNKIICRKCGGDHLKSKCGKEKEEPVVINTEPIIIKQEYEKPVNDRRDYIRNNKPRNYDKSKLSTVKLSDLPLDTTESELYELLQDWGHIVKVKVLSYNECNVAYIDFIHNEEAMYFVEAIHKTPFDRYIITAELCQNKQQ